MTIENVKGASKNRVYNLDYAFGGSEVVVVWCEPDGRENRVKMKDLIDLYKKSIENENENN